MGLSTAVAISTRNIITVQAATTPTASGNEAFGSSRLARENVNATAVDEMKPPKPYPQTSLCTSTQAEIHRYLSLDFDGLTIQVVRLIAPILDRLNSCRGQKRVAADELKVLDRAVLGNDCLQDDGTMYARLASNRRAYLATK